MTPYRSYCATVSTVEVKTENTYRKLRYSTYVFIFESAGIFYDKKIMCLKFLSYHKVLAITCNNYLNTDLSLSISHSEILIRL